MDIINFVVSLLLGMLPEVLFFTMYLIYVKDIKEKKFKLFFLIMFIYILCIMIIRFKILYYISFIALVYAILKILYKKNTQIIDTFVFSIAFSYLCFIGFITSRFVNNSYILYYIMYLLNRLLLFISFLFKNKFYILYKKYYSLWNRNYDKKQPIKSITLRNISLFSLNIFIFIMNIISVSMTNFIK